MDRKEKLCQACLSSDRNLFNTSQLQSEIQHVMLSELITSTGAVCWECRALIIKFSTFKTRIKDAQNTLRRCSQHYNASSLSRLSYMTNDCYNYEFVHRDDPLTQPKDTNEVKIKDEYESDEINEETIFNDESKYDRIVNIKENVDTAEVFAEILNTKEERKVKNVIKKFDLKKKGCKRKTRCTIKDEKELKEKFTSIVFTEEEMLKNREEKRNQPNFKKIPYKCDTCVLGFTRKDTYDMHLDKKHDKSIGKHICPVCQTRYATKKQMERHRRKHYQCYKCRLCTYETLETWSAVNHCKVKHCGDTVDNIHCSHCSFVASTPEALSDHNRTEHAMVCDECGEKFKGPSTLRAHKRRIHGMKREFVCEICRKTFKTKSRLESHIVSHNTALAQTLSYCSVCNVQYKNIYVYRNHLRTSANHADEVYQCKECKKKFASKVYWKKHYNFYHLHKSKFQCELCNKLFISDWRLKNHRQTQHGMSRTRDHHCNICGKQFFTQSTLAAHQLTHSARRSFMCADCGATFRQPPALYTHCRLRHSRAPPPTS